MVSLTAENLDSLNAALKHLSGKANAWFQRVSRPDEKCYMRMSADLRYLRQNYELSISLLGANLSLEDIATIQMDFHKAHRAEYGHSSPGETIQVVHLRLQAVRPLPKPDLNPINDDSRDVIVKSSESRLVWFTDGLTQSQVHQRKDLNTGHTLNGPAIIQEKESTTLVENGWCSKVDRFGNMVIEKD